MKPSVGQAVAGPPAGRSRRLGGNVSEREDDIVRPAGPLRRLLLWLVPGGDRDDWLEPDRDDPDADPARDLPAPP
jgi:hypothetical protein